MQRRKSSGVVGVVAFIALIVVLGVASTLSVGFIPVHAEGGAVSPIDPRDCQAGSCGATPTEADAAAGPSATVEVDGTCTDSNSDGLCDDNVTYKTIQAAIIAALPGDTISVAPTIYTEVGQIVIAKNLTIVGDDRDTTIIKPAQDTGSSGDSRGWFLVNPGITLNLSHVTLDGQGKNIMQGVRSFGNGVLDDVVVQNVAYPGYNGLGVVIFDQMTVSNSTFQNIGRVGIIVFGATATGTVTNNSYIGKGPGDWLDYAVEVGGGGHATITGNTISDCEGVAVSDGSTSAGILTTTYYGAGTAATVHNNFITGNTAAVAVGYDGSDTSGVVIAGNDLSGYTSYAVNSTAPSVDASGNWWGSNVAATVKTAANGGTLVDFTPWLDGSADTAPATPGFQGSFATLWVDDDSPQSGTTGRIQEGVNLVSGSTVYVAPGTYTENVAVNKVMTLDGAGSGNNPVVDTVLQGTSGVGLTLSAGTDATHRVIVKDLHVTGYDTGVVASSFNTLDNVAAVSNTTYGINLSPLTDLVVTGSKFNSNGTGLKIASTASVDQLSISNSEFNGNANIGWYSDKGTTPTSNITNVTVTDTTFNGNINKGIYTEKLSDAIFTRVTVDGSGVGGALNHRAGVDLNLKYGNYQNIQFVDSVITNSGKGDPNGGGILIKARRDGSYAGNPATLTNVKLSGMVIQNNGEASSAYAAGVRIGESNNGSAPDNSGLTNVSVVYSLITGNAPYGVRVITTNAVNTTCNWWQAVSGPSLGANPGGLGQALESSSATFSPWLLYNTDGNAGVLGFQLPTSFTVTAGGDISAADNNYRSLANAIGCVQTGQTVTLGGTFDISAPNAQASWALGNDAKTGAGYTNDDYVVDVPANANNVTLTAASLGATTIQGPGDVSSVDLEGFLQFYNTGINTNWTISNLRILDFDLGIGMYCCAGGPGDKYTGTTITNNLIRLAKDLKGASASGPEDFQNIGIHLAYGQNQTISNNTIEIPGDGDSNPASAGQDWWTYGATPGWLYSSQVGLQSNTHGGAAYDGLQITGNAVKVLTAQGANPARIIGIWENGHANSSDVTVSNNQFLNLAGGNDPALNRQMAFRATSHSSGSTTVTYSGNTVQGASMGFGPMNVNAGNQPIQMAGNTAINVKTGILLGQNGILHLTNNKLLSVLGSGAGISVPATASVAVDSTPPNVIGGFAAGVQVDGSATVDNAKLVMNGTGLLVQGTGSGSITNSAIAGNSAFGVNNTAATGVNATGNFWGSCDGPGPVGPGSGDKVSTNVAFSSWLTSPPAGTLQAMVDAAPAGGTIQLGNCTYGGATIDKPLTIRGVPGTIITEGSPAFTVTANDVTIENLVIDGNPGGTTPKSSFPGILVQAGVDNLIVQNTEITDWANGIEVAGDTTNLKIVGNWVHDNTANGLLIDSGVTVSGATGVINGNLFKANGANGVRNDGATSNLLVEYNSWGSDGGPGVGGANGASGSLDYTPWTFTEPYIDVDPTSPGDQYQRNVDESTSFNVAFNVDAESIYGVTFTFTYDTAKLQFNAGATTFSPPWNGRCVALAGLPAGTIGYRCSLLPLPPTPDPEFNGGTVATFNFTATGPGLAGSGPWQALFNIASTQADTNAAAIGGVKVFVNNAGYGAPSIPARDITDGNDGQIDIRGIAQYRGYVDLQGRTNDSGAGFQVFASSAKPGTAIASATSSSSGVYTSAYMPPNLLTIGTTYHLYVDRALYLPTTATSAASYTHSKELSSRPLTTVGTVILLGGDANDNNVIDIGDATCIGDRYNLTPATCGGVGSADVNGDGVVNILDLVLMGGNYDLTFSPWTP